MSSKGGRGGREGHVSSIYTALYTLPLQIDFLPTLDKE